MSYVQDGNKYKVYGIGNTGRTNALIEGFYRNYPNLKHKIKPGTNYLKAENIKVISGLKKNVEEYNDNGFEGFLSKVTGDERNIIVNLSNIYNSYTDNKLLKFKDIDKAPLPGQNDIEINIKMGGSMQLPTIPELLQFTGNKDIDKAILLGLNDKDLGSICVQNTYLANICRLDSFWKSKVISRYPNDIKGKPEEETWKLYYIKLGDPYFGTEIRKEMLTRLRRFLSNPLAEERVLDVSRMSPNGVGIRSIYKPGSGSRKKGVPGIKVVSSNRENYVTFMKMLGPKYMKYVDEYDLIEIEPINLDMLEILNINQN